MNCIQTMSVPFFNSECRARCRAKIKRTKKDSGTSFRSGQLYYLEMQAGNKTGL